MTIDPAFTKDSKTFQKRNKQISASGNPLNVLAIDPYNENGSGKYSATGKQNVVYFDDINLNAEEFAPEFMDAVAY